MIGKIDVWADCGYCQALDNVEHSVKTRREICSQRLSELCPGPTQFPVSARQCVAHITSSGPSHHQISFLSSSGTGSGGPCSQYNRQDLSLNPPFTL